MLIGIVLGVFGGLLTFGVLYDSFVRKSFKAQKSQEHLPPHANQHIDNGRVDGAANQMSNQSTGF